MSPRILGSSQGVRQVVKLLLGQAGYVVGYLLLSIVISRLLGPEGNGVVVLMTSIPLMVGTVLDMGLGAAVTVMVKRREVTPSTAASLLSLYCLTLSAVVLGLGMGVCRGLVSTALPGVDSMGLAAIVVGTASTLCCAQARQMLIATGHVGLSSLLWPADRVLALAGIAFLAASSSLRVRSLELVFIVDYGSCAVLSWLVVMKRIGIGPAPTRRCVYRAARFGAILGLGNGIQALNYRLDTLIVNGLLDTSAVGLYGVATSLSSMLWYLPNAVSSVWLPRAAAVDRRLSSERTRQLLVRTLLLTTGAGVALALLGGWMIRLLFGSQFGASYPLLLVLVPGAIAFVIPKIVNPDLVAHRVTWVSVVAATLGLVVTIGANLTLVPAIGVIGAAVASTAAYAVSAAAYLGFWLRYTRGAFLRHHRNEEHDDE